MTEMRETETKPTPDPTVLTTEALQREVSTLEDRDKRLSADIRREIDLVQRELEAQQSARQRELEATQKLTDTSLHAMDKATELRLSTINNMPVLIRESVDHLKDLMNEKLNSINMRFSEQDRLTSTQFKERDTRTEREARDNKLAVDAAFAAQEKQAVAQNEGNQLAINKSEGATAETIKTNMDLTKSEINALRKSAEDREQRQREVDDDMKKRLGSIEASLVGIAKAKQGAEDTRTDSRAGNNLVVAVFGTFLVALSIGVTVAAMFLRR